MTTVDLGTAPVGTRVQDEFLVLERDDRTQANAMDPNREQTRQARIAEAQAEYDKAAADLARVQQSLADLAEEARRKSIPPGWVR